MNILQKWRGGDALPPRASISDMVWAWLGGFVAIGSVAALSGFSGYPLMLGSFGASCVLLYGFPDSPFSQPRNVIGGHVLASFIGLLCLTLFGVHWWSAAIAAGTTIAAMMATRTVHPPAGSNPVIVMLSVPTWKFLLAPTLIGALLLVLISLFFNNLRHEKTYPRYWV